MMMTEALNDSSFASLLEGGSSINWAGLLGTLGFSALTG